MFIRLEKDDPIKYLKNLSIVEKALNRGMAEQLFEVRWGVNEARRRFKQMDKAGLLEAFEILLRTQIARDKLMFYRLGLLKPQKKGDLRSARIVLDEQEQLFAILRLETGRRHPGTIAMIQSEAAKMDPKFFSRVAAALKRSPVDFEHIDSTKLQKFLLVGWDQQLKDSVGNAVPQLCTCSDPVIAQLAGILLELNVTDRSVRKTWERLGLCKAVRLEYWTIEKEKGKIVISDLRHRRI